jgi:hypothetical protein
LSEKIFHETLSKLETIYSNLIKGDTSLEQEIEYRIALIDIISTLEASIINKKAQNKEFIDLLAKAREPLMNWDPYGHWFRQQKKLVDSIYNIIVNAKGVVFTKADESSSETSRLKQELDSLRSEITELRQLMSDLIQTKKQTVDSSTQQQEQPVSPPIKKEPPPKKTNLPPISSPSKPSSVESATPSPADQSQKRSDKAEIEESLAIINGLMDSQESQPPTEHLPSKQTPKDKDETASKPTPAQTSELDQMLPQEPQESKPKLSPEIPTKSAEEEDTSLATSTISKLSESDRDSTGKVLTQMKSIIQQAEEETERQISSFKDTINQKTETTEEKEAPPPPKQPLETPIIPPIVHETETVAQPTSAEVQQPDKEDSWVKPSEVLKQKATQEKEIASTGSDPYMQLLTLEAEKYRLEKELEKNETAFQEGTKNKQEFDNTIQQINQELSVVREKIASLRKQLTS